MQSRATTEEQWYEWNWTAAESETSDQSWFTHHWDQAIEQPKYAIDLDPNYWFDYHFLGRAYEQKGNFAAAIETFQRGLKMDDNLSGHGCSPGHAAIELALQ